MLPLFLLVSLLPTFEEKTAPAADPASEIAKAEMQKLQGEWSVTTHEVGGKKSNPQSIAGWRLTVKNGTMSTRDGGDLLDESTFTLLTAVKPRAVDLRLSAGPDKGKLVRGIYKLEGNTLTVCVAEPERERPKEFTTKEGSGHMLFVFTRIQK